MTSRSIPADLWLGSPPSPQHQPDPSRIVTWAEGVGASKTCADFLTSAYVSIGVGARSQTAEGVVFEAMENGTTEISATNLGGYHALVNGTPFKVLPSSRGWDVRAFGAKLDGVTDDSSAVKRALWAAIAAKRSPRVGSNDVVPNAIFFAGGECRIAEPRALMGVVGAGRAMGLTYEGGATGTTIHFDHDDEDYLCYNANEFLFVRFRNLRFTANSDNARFMFVDASGGAQDVLFENCNWNGTWQKLYRLEGGNNNSEWRWSNCAITATIRDTVLDIPIEGSDQFLNYWATNCKFWLYDGQFLRARKGGHFHFVNCDWSGHNPGMTLNTSTKGAPLFELLGTDHNRGVCSMSVTGGRVEHKNLLSKLIYCEWNQGHVSFRDFDAGAVTPTGYENVTTATFVSGNDRGANVTFDACTLIGKHSFSNGAASFGYTHNAEYRLCDVMHGKPDEFLTFTRGSVGGTWLVALRGCRTPTQSTGNVLTVWNAIYGGRYSRNSGQAETTFIFRDPLGAGQPLGSNTLRAILPAGAMITGVKIVNPGVPFTNNYTVNWQLRDGAGTLIAETGDHAFNTANHTFKPHAHVIPSGAEEIYFSEAHGAATVQGRTYCAVTFVC